VVRRPGGAELDVTASVESVLVQLAVRYAVEPQWVVAMLEELAATHYAEQDAAPEFRDTARAAREDAAGELLEELGGARLPVYGRDVARLADELDGCISRRMGAAA
jgi:hypothetical protein